MIEYNPKGWFRHIVEFRKMDTLRTLWQELIIVGIYAAIVVYLKQMFIDNWAEASPERAERYIKAMRDTTIVHSILGFVLSLLLVFRTNTAYDRWWEGRRLWGSLVNSSRNLAVKYSALLRSATPETAALRERIRLLLGDFPFELKEHLRGRQAGAELRSPAFDAADGIPAASNSHPVHLPLSIISRLYQTTAQLVSTGTISKEDLLVIDADLRNLNEVLGACERILKTPIPYTYSLFLKKFVFFYILLLPLGLGALFSYLSIPLSMFVFYVLVSLEIIAEEIEEPFGDDANDLPLQTISETIRKNVDSVFQAV